MVEKRAKRPLPERKSGEGKKRERKVDRQNVTDKEKRKKKKRKSEIRPGYDIFPLPRCIVPPFRLHRNTQTRSSNRSLTPQPFHRFHKAPSGYSAKFDLTLCCCCALITKWRFTCNDTPPIIKRLHNRHPFSELEKRFVG